MPETVFINGKFSAQRLTGVQRFAGELVRALDAAALPGEDWVLLVPPQAEPPRLRHIEVRRVGPALPSLHLWEQLALPLAARGGLLLNLAGSAPLVARRQCCTFHDAAVFEHAAAFTPAFRIWYRFHFRWLARRAERLLTVSAHARRQLAHHLGLPAASIGVVPNGGEHLLAAPTDHTVIDRLGLRSLRWFVAVGSESQLKNWPTLLRAWTTFAPPPDARLVLVGGRNTAVFAGVPSAQLLPAQAMHAGPVSDAALRALLEGAVALLMPSLDEGFGLPPLEAMALGCPVAVAQAGALPEVCGPAALYFDPRDVQGMAGVLSTLLEDPARRQALAAAGRVRAAGFTWAHAARLLRQALGRQGGAL
jgi:glycosyltransferase involved in cell wall biosynthesis